MTEKPPWIHQTYDNETNVLNEYKICPKLRTGIDSNDQKAIVFKSNKGISIA